MNNDVLTGMIANDYDGNGNGSRRSGINNNNVNSNKMINGIGFPGNIRPVGHDFMR